MAENKLVSGKVFSVQAAGHYVGRSGRNEGKTIYKFDVLLDNGARGQLSCVEGELNGTEAPIAAGETHEFNVYESTNPDYQDSWYLRKPKANGSTFAGKKWTPDPEKESRKERWAKQIMITRMGCLNSALSLNASGGIETSKGAYEAVMATAEMMEAWVKRGLDLKALVNPAPVAPPAPEPAKPAPAPQRQQIPDHDTVPF